MTLARDEEQLLKSLKKVAKSHGEYGKELTSLIGELSTCKIRKLRWQPSKGYDAIKDTTKFQIKTRKSWSTPKVNQRGRLGRFGKKGEYGFDYGLYVELDQKFEVSGIWQRKKTNIIELEKGELKGRGLHISTFLSGKRKGITQLYP